MKARFAHHGPMAIAASAYGQEYELVSPPEPALTGTVAVVMVMGPLSHHEDWWGGDTYDAVEERVAKALATSASTVVLKFDSPGGETNGCLECARTLRKMAAAAGKRLVAYVDEFAASAAYALACAASEVYLPPSAYLGSIGVIDTIVDFSNNDRINGIDVAVITSGMRKADGNPHVPISDETKAVVQGRVDSLAQLFYELVAEFRGIDAMAIKSMEAAIYRGQDAVNVKLADGVMSWDALLAMLASGGTIVAPTPTAAGEQESNMKRSELIAALKSALAEDPAPAPEKPEPDGDEKMSGDDLRAALKALLAEGEEPKQEPKAESAPAPKPHPEPDGDEAAKSKALAAVAGRAAMPTPPDAGLPPGHHYLPNAAAATPAATAITELEGRVRAMELEKKQTEEAKERAQLVAGTQMSDATRKWLSAPETPLSDVRAACKALPKAMPQNPAAAAMVNPTLAQGQGQPQSQSGLEPAVARQLSSMMGLHVAEPNDIVWGGQSKDPSDTTTAFDRVFPTAMSRDRAREVLKANEERMRQAGAALGNTIGGGR